MLITVAGLVTLQSCEDETGEIISHYAFTTPTLVTPANDSYVYTTATSMTLQWDSKNESGDPVKANVYFGTSETPALYKANHNALTLSVPIEKGTPYFWSVEMEDANGIPTEGPTWSFTALCPFVPSKAVGSYHSVSPPSEWASEGDITLTADPTDQYIINVVGIEAIEGVTEDNGPLVMNIDPVNHEVTVPKKVIASIAFGAYHNLAYAGTGTYDACDGSYEMHFTISADEGSFGTFLFTFTRNP